ncbi:hypothetical protein KP509_32G053100 [Ceratopteris richardii]|uniref:dCTP pyrophosphatase 1 n=1 Tax=Ceratopteris richardii TaxID=49495 RepID=A0A8T2QTE8_CERRI|nr:hypothetical protein KP509_32G053100 [Ceratopteris richardii]
MDNLITQTQTQKFLRSDVALTDLTRMLADFARERNWESFHSPRNLLLALVGEVGELSEIFQWRGEVPPRLPHWSAEEKEHLEEELSDVLLYLVRLADVCNVNLGEAALEKLRENASKYPVDAMKRSYDGPLTAFNKDAGKTTADTNRKLPIA